MKRSLGFTLIELMIVIAIIGIIAAIVLPLFGIGESHQNSGGKTTSVTQYQPPEPVITCVSGVKFVEGRQVIDHQGRGIPC